MGDGGDSWRRRDRRRHPRFGVSGVIFPTRVRRRRLRQLGVPERGPSVLAGSGHRANPGTGAALARPRVFREFHPARLLARAPARHDGSQLSPRPVSPDGGRGPRGGLESRAVPGQPDRGAAVRPQYSWAELGLRPHRGGGLALLDSPSVSLQAGQTMSDVVATAWVRWRSSQRSVPAPGASALWAAAAGAAFGMAVLVRPTNALVILPLVLALPTRAKTWLAFAAGGAPFAAFQLAYGTAAFGGPFKTGYRSLLSEGMALSNFPPRARHYAFWTARLLSPLVPLGWAAVAADRRVSRRDRAVLLTWFAGFFLFYSFYGPYEAWWYTRFLLPGYPAVILGALLGRATSSSARGVPRWGRPRPRCWWSSRSLWRSGTSRAGFQVLQGGSIHPRRARWRGAACGKTASSSP